MNSEQVRTIIQTALAQKAAEPLLASSNYADVVKALMPVDENALDIETRFMAFDYIRDRLIAEAGSRDLIQLREYEHPELGSYKYPAAEEESFTDEIALLARLRGNFQYSDELKKRIDAFAEKSLEGLCAEPEFVDEFRKWKSLTPDEIRTNGCGTLFALSVAAKESLNMPVTDLGLYIVDTLPEGDMVTYAPDPYKGEKLEDAHVLFRGDHLADFDAPDFGALLLHEKIHHLILHLAFKAFHGETFDDPALERDGKLALLRKKYRISYISPIQSLYFTDPEEVICFTHTNKARDFLKRAIPDALVPEIAPAAEHN